MRSPGRPALQEIADIVFGAERAAQLRDPLSTYTDRLAQVRLRRPDDPPFTGGQPAGPPVRLPDASRLGLDACRERIAALDPYLLAFAWIGGVRSPGDGHGHGDADRDGADSGAGAGGGGTAVPLDGGPLAGLVVGVKDVIDVAGMPTRAGSPLTDATPVSADAPVVARLRRAGAAVVGKVRCTEWALNDPAPTLNPWDAARTPGGSSSGSGVAVATGMCDASLDTQTAGDVLRPAAFTGVVGFKPTARWAPSAGCVPVAPSLDTLGVTARRVGVAGALARALADSPEVFDEPRPARPPRLGALVDPWFSSVDAAAAENLAEVLGRLSAAGAFVTTVTTPADPALLYAAHRVLVFSECAAFHQARYLAAADWFGPRARELVELGLLTPAPSYLDAVRVRRDARRRLARLLSGFDALVMPVTPGPAPARDTTGDNSFQIPWTLCGLPALSLPSGLADGLPLGVQLVAGPHRDGVLLGAARWCEQVLNVNLRPPA